MMPSFRSHDMAPPRFLKLSLATLAALAGLVAGGAALGIWLGERRMQRFVDVRVVPVAAAKDAAALRHGKYLYESRGCGECHGLDGRGKVMIDEGEGLFVRAPNITRGPGSAVSSYGDPDWVRAIRHGVDPRGRALLMMPSEDYNRMNDADFAALVGYVKSLPPLAGEPGLVRLPAAMKILYGLGAMRDAATSIDHRLPPPPAVPATASAQHGAYVATMCIRCHGRDFSGGRTPGAPRDWPAASDLAPGGVMARYDTAEKFAAMMRTGRRPDGTEVSRVMPFESLARLNDTDLQAMYLFFRSLPPRAAPAS